MSHTRSRGGTGAPRGTTGGLGATGGLSASADSPRSTGSQAACGTRKSILDGVLVAGIAWLLFSAVPAADDESVKNTSTTTPARRGLRASGFKATGRYVGVSSCAAATCHGGDRSQGRLASAYSIWAQKDTHAHAYSTLHNEQSRRMARLLKLNAPAHQAKECLSCHAIPAKESQLAAEHRFEIQDGVSCEACHGPAEKWLGPHVRRDWKQKTAREKQLLGFRDTKNLFTRARVCAGCHVGSTGRDVNHDLIAAGHPRLNFELGAYHNNMPAHWTRKKDRQKGGPVFETQLWLVGQVVSAEAALKLLATRATDDANGSIWPEFAEYDCFACHHNLQSPSWRQQRGNTNRRLGGYAWGTWYFSLLPAVAKAMNSAPLDATIGKLQQAMGRPIPDARAVREHANALSVHLALLAGRIERAESTDRKLLARVTGAGQQLSGKNWDAAAQLYLAIAARHQGTLDSRAAEPTPKDKQIQSELERIRKLLLFPEMHQSPRNFGPDRISAINKHLARIQDLLDNE